MAKNVHSSWSRWKKSKTFKRLRDQEKAIRENPQFQRERKILQEKYPPFIDPKLKDWPKKAKTYPPEWDKFCQKWGIDRDAFIKGRIKVCLPISIKGKMGQRKIALEIKDPSFTGQELRDLEPLLIAAKNDLVGIAPSRAGRRSEKLLHARIKKRFREIKRVTEKAKDAIEQLAKEFLLGEDTVRNIVYKKT
ncbi:MAG: hypothetical protein PHN49_00215 [Candidatus Omnitrophica bacterium]|nr:hypothetical protein [Candidatus Omnitrophota bacterium]